MDCHRVHHRPFYVFAMMMSRNGVHYSDVSGFFRFVVVATFPQFAVVSVPAAVLLGLLVVFRGDLLVPERKIQSKLRVGKHASHDKMHHPQRDTAGEGIKTVPDRQRQDPIAAKLQGTVESDACDRNADQRPGHGKCSPMVVVVRRRQVGTIERHVDRGEFEIGKDKVDYHQREEDYIHNYAGLADIATGSAAKIGFSMNEPMDIVQLLVVFQSGYQLGRSLGGGLWCWSRNPSGLSSPRTAPSDRCGVVRRAIVDNYRGGVVGGVDRSGFLLRFDVGQFDVADNRHVCS